MESLDPAPLKTRALVSGVFLLICVTLLLIIPAKWFGIGRGDYQRPDNLLPLLTQGLTVGIQNDPIVKASSQNFSSTTFTGFSTKEDKTAFARLSDSNNMTTSFLKNTVGLSSYLDSQNLTDDDSLSSVGTSIAEETLKLEGLKTYTASNLKIVQGESFASLKEYGNAIGILFLNIYSQMDLGKDLLPLQDYQSKQDPKKLTVYTGEEKLLSEIIQALTTMQVPASAVEAHLNFTNAAEHYRVAVAGFAKADSDPMRAFVELGSYKDTLTGLVQSAAVFGDYFYKKNIVFSPKESGYILTGVILSK